MGNAFRADDGQRADERDRVLPATRVLAAVIVPFLLVAFIVLYPSPGDTHRWFAWTIKPTMTPMVLASAYLGGSYFFVRVYRSTQWHTVKAGFVPVTLFASCLGIATIIHWDKFNHRHVAFWIWAALYFTTPFLVLATYVRNQALGSQPAPDDLRIPPVARAVIGLTGLAALLLGAYLFLLPRRAIDIWPWTLTPLTARVVGATLMLGVCGLMIAADPRWTTARIMLQVARIMIALFLLAAARAHDQFDTSRPLTWMLGIGLAGVLVAATVLDLRMQRRSLP
ncbi:MAG: hypothetical protein QOJ74_1233 [Ilumatobacteraceae bacterium]|nr:hypothetical protein [Ilumatobacteraceae bacterium]